jgi:hypothetical protein
MPSTPAPTGFTVIVCRSATCGRGGSGGVAEHLFGALREAVRSTRHGVLVSTGCLLGHATCAGRAPGPVVLVQPCDAERAPLGPAVRIGPLSSAADVEALAAWLRAGLLDPGLLPARLLGVHRRMAAAPLN